ncbi:MULTISPECIES: SoxR reducing system RseC family protein [Thiomicrorhabdus]|uniref:SoxR reducing system RseC family protein n=1 Tax=Thiomicrorhabdus heinhorstiae TaxID=2748010 RepID=A0ABS0C0Q5_9GAMM|nr:MULTISPECIES: SoxR reducing system RseC family protein [Thiomicrorhabdus]MBF6057917.1 SoxR reducing system RseC family protein [Thiomicrorhabdus heinhorstiae]
MANELKNQIDPMHSEASGDELYAEAQVVKVDADSVWVLPQRKSACGSCSSESCGSGSLAKLFNRQQSKPLKLPKTLECRPGDWVNLSINQSRLVQYSFLAYGVPLIGLFSFAILGKWLVEHYLQHAGGMTDLGAIVGGFGGLLLGWWATRIWSKPVKPRLVSVSRN